MIIAIGIIIGILCGIFNVYNFKTDKSKKNIARVIVGNTFAVNIFTFAVMRFIMGRDGVFLSADKESTYWLKFIIMALAVCVFCIALPLFTQKAPFFVKKETKFKKTTKAVKIVSTVIFALGTFAFTATVWGKEYFGDLTADQILINLNSPTEGTDPAVYVSGIESVVLTTILFTTVFALIAFSDYTLKFTRKDKNPLTVYPSIVTRIVSLVAALSFCVGACTYGINEFGLVDLYLSYIRTSDFVENNFVDAKKIGLEFPEKKRNLIHIYLESMENTFLSKELGGMMEDNLIPDLYELLSDGYSFSHTTDTPGGAYESTGAGWSVSAMVNMGTGLPMKVPDKPNQYGGKDNFLPGATALGDILKEQGYEQTIMFGANANFGGLSYYYQSHGDFTIIDHKEAIKRGLIPEDYDVFWGYEDDKLYEFAKDEITRLSQTGNPFHFVMETADTHSPKGYLPEHAPTPYDTQYANAISYSDTEAVKFINWIRSQPFYENTTIVIIGDHLSMANNFMNSIDGIKDYQRTCYNLILNPSPDLPEISQDRLFGRSYGMFDIFPTILSSIGVEIPGDRLGIGTDLFSDRKTVFEEFGVDFVNDELVKRSDFYNENILNQDSLTV